jgi:drug/metabolite transporter (DMT)-like permease
VKDGPTIRLVSIPPALTRTDNVKLAIAVILLTNLALSLGDAAVKQISADFVLWQIFVIRSIIAIPILIAVFGLRPRSASLVPRHFGWVGLRSLMLTLMWVAYYSALPHLAFGIAAVIYYTLPIFITLLAALFVGDRIGLMGWGAVILGFAGVLLILRPAAEGFNAYALLPLVSAILYAVAMILTRTKCREENPLILSLSLMSRLLPLGYWQRFSSRWSMNHLPQRKARPSSLVNGRSWAKPNGLSWPSLRRR